MPAALAAVNIACLCSRCFKV